MSSTIKRVKALSTICQISVISFTVLSLVYVLHQQFANQEIRYSQNELILSMWADEKYSNTLLSMALSPILLLFVLSSYWMVLLFQNFKHGDFFSSSSLKYYVVYIATKACTLLYEMGLTTALSFWKKAIEGELILLLPLELGHLTTLMLMGVVAYILKQAKVIEEENKEFI